MIRETRTIQTRLAIVGTGLAGLAAAIFASGRGIKTAQVGHTGLITYTTGYLDLLGELAGRIVEDPWHNLDQLRREHPGHPFCNLENAEIRKALDMFTSSLSAMGVGYTAPTQQNLRALLPSGVIKPTISVPLTMEHGVAALKRQARTVIVGFSGLPGFSSAEFVANMKPYWPGLAPKSLEFPGMEGQGQLFPEVMARALEVADKRQRLADIFKPHLDAAEYLGLPAILGVHAPDSIHAHLEELLGLPIFEIPTMPPSVPGIRLREMFEQVLPQRGVILVPQHKVERLQMGGDGVLLSFTDPFGDVKITSEAVILATGRFLSGGLVAQRDGIREPRMQIPVTQPDSRDQWYGEEYLDRRGHAINRAGVNVDGAFQPIDAAGRRVHPRLFAAGTILAGQDWVLQRSGAAVSIASAYGAVRSFAEMFGAATA